MSEFDFSSDDLYGLEVCLRDLDEMLGRAEEAKTDKAVRYALVKTFELTFDMALKTMRKYLIAHSGKSDEAATFDLQDLIRLADQYGLVRIGWPGWKRFRTNRGRTVHTYGEAIAMEVSAQLGEFSEEVHVLLQRLKRNLEEDRG